MPVLHFFIFFYVYLQAFPLFQLSFFLVKMVNHYDVHVIFQDIEHWLQENILHHFLHYSFMRSLLDWGVTFIHSNLFNGRFYDIAEPYKLFTSQDWRNDHSLFSS